MLIKITAGQRGPLWFQGFPFLVMAGNPASLPKAQQRLQLLTKPCTHYSPTHTRQIRDLWNLIFQYYQALHLKQMTSLGIPFLDLLTLLLKEQNYYRGCLFRTTPWCFNHPIRAYITFLRIFSANYQNCARLFWVGNCLQNLILYAGLPHPLELTENCQSNYTKLYSVSIYSSFCLLVSLQN